MRILMLFTLGFGAACGLCVYVFPQTPDIFVPIVIGMISVPLPILAGKRTMATVLTAVWIWTVKPIR